MDKTPRINEIIVWFFQEFDDVTLAGKLFHVRAAATGNARSPTVDSRVDGTSNADVYDDRRRCRPGILATSRRSAKYRRVADNAKCDARPSSDAMLFRPRG